MTYQATTDTTSDDKLWGLLAYLLSPIIPIVILLMDDKKNRPFLKHNAVQALALFVVQFVLSIIVIGCCVSPIYVVAMIYFAVKTYQGELVTVPYLTDFLKQQKWL